MYVVPPPGLPRGLGGLCATSWRRRSESGVAQKPLNPWDKPRGVSLTERAMTVRDGDTFTTIRYLSCLQYFCKTIPPVNVIS